MTKRYVPSPHEIPSGICECGCGEKTPLAKRTNVSKRYFAGHPTRFAVGHSAPVPRHLHPKFTGRHVINDYVLVYRPDHPKALKRAGLEGYILEHRVVWEDANGRLLSDNELVHHINGVKGDNRPENLVAILRPEHNVIHRTGKTQSAETRRQIARSQAAATAEGRFNRAHSEKAKHNISAGLRRFHDKRQSSSD